LLAVNGAVQLLNEQKKPEGFYIKPFGDFPIFCILTPESLRIHEGFVFYFDKKSD